MIYENKKIILFGIGPLARTVYQISKDLKDITVCAFMADDEFCATPFFCNLPLIKSSELIINKKITEEYNFLLCIGYKSLRNRQKVFEKLIEGGCNFINLVHPSATILSEVHLGVNNIIFPNITIENNVSIGNNNVIWSQSLIAHDSIIMDHNYFSAKVLIGGNCRIGKLCFLGNSVFMINDLIIKDETYLIAGSGLFINTEPHTKYMGYPARKIGYHIENGIEIY